MIPGAIALLGLLAQVPPAEAAGPAPGVKPGVSGSPAVTALPDADRVRIAEAFRLADALGDRIWPGWNEAPFAVLLVTPEREFLIGHPAPSSDFTLIGEDALLKEKVWFRQRQYDTSLLATFPAVGGVPTIVIGQAENTASKTSTRWVITLLHEHFHQLQDSRPGQDAAVKALDLARGDQTGMWMLNYPFPYDSPDLKRGFSTLSRSLAGALRARGEPDFTARLAAYAEDRRKFRSLLAPDDARYLAFQVWKEGIARYTEYRLAELAAGTYDPSPEFRALEDYRSFDEIARGIRRGIERELAHMKLDRSGRSVVYNLGAAEGLVLDGAAPGWMERYFEERFSLDPFFDSHGPDRPARGGRGAPGTPR